MGGTSSKKKTTLRSPTEGLKITVPTSPIQDMLSFGRKHSRQMSDVSIRSPSFALQAPSKSPLRPSQSMRERTSLKLKALISAREQDAHDIKLQAIDLPLPAARAHSNETKPGLKLEDDSPRFIQDFGKAAHAHKFQTIEKRTQQVRERKPGKRIFVSHVKHQNYLHKDEEYLRQQPEYEGRQFLKNDQPGLFVQFQKSVKAVTLSSTRVTRKNEIGQQHVPQIHSAKDSHVVFSTVHTQAVDQVIEQNGQKGFQNQTSLVHRAPSLKGNRKFEALLTRIAQKAQKPPATSTDQAKASANPVDQQMNEDNFRRLDAKTRSYYRLLHAILPPHQPTEKQTLKEKTQVIYEPDSVVDKKFQLELQAADKLGMMMHKEEKLIDKIAPEEETVRLNRIGRKSFQHVHRKTVSEPPKIVLSDYKIEKKKKTGQWLLDIIKSVAKK